MLVHLFTTLYAGQARDASLHSSPRSLVRTQVRPSSLHRASLSHLRSVPLHRHQPARRYLHAAYRRAKQRMSHLRLPPSLTSPQVMLSPIIGNLASPLAQRLHGKIDVLVFNPPYVPTSVDEASYAQDERGIAGAWAGGEDGMRVTNVLLGMLDVRVSLTRLCTIADAVRSSGFARARRALLPRRPHAE